MTHACCPACRLRVVHAATTAPEACPGCGRPLTFAPAADVLGLPLVVPVGGVQAESVTAEAQALPVPPGRP